MRGKFAIQLVKDPERDDNDGGGGPGLGPPPPSLLSLFRLLETSVAFDALSAASIIFIKYI